MTGECHSIIRDTDGLHADEALDELCKTIYCKIYDERTVIEKTEDTEFKFQIYGASNTAEVAANIRELYEEARNRDIEIYSKRIPNYERSRGVFKANIRLSDIALYKVVEKLQAYSFIDSNADIKGTVGTTTGTPLVRPSRSSRTKDSSSQTSCAHDG